ncbi:hypothetical protein Plhal304r1_c051g0134871 [Plasmopara halstedii]
MATALPFKHAQVYSHVIQEHQFSCTNDYTGTYTEPTSCGISTTSHSTPVSTSSTCTSKIVPWWELEYQCPPPGHLGAHVVPVSIDVPGTTKNVDPTKKLALKKCSLTSVETCFDEKKESFQSGVVIYETPERGRRDLHRKLLARRDSTPCLLIDNSPSQKRKMRSQDVIECEAALFSKELKRFHEFRYVLLLRWRLNF